MDNQNIASSKKYILVFVALVALVLISTGISTLNLGYLNPLLTIGLAGVSAIIVLTQFMKIKLDGSFARLLVAGILALALLIFFVAFVG
ncbi:hypothetical protein [Carboxylicivirga marina]|uniref:Uncharacterized protein n=1 Tax=Carboxylicivirga marina TaxID=2800988 RepID=A0ABS1HHV8_9BACT|nr:hypothetical protein [Carboxylicivirga marina]MBK3517262.1 hypothetical protein [Carboxylicivirga marina]